jgi:hypothetical protein
MWQVTATCDQEHVYLYVQAYEIFKIEPLNLCTEDMTQPDKRSIMLIDVISIISTPKSSLIITHNSCSAFKPGGEGDNFIHFRLPENPENG